jgi:hypothetical protein
MRNDMRAPFPGLAEAGLIPPRSTINRNTAVLFHPS